MSSYTSTIEFFVFCLQLLFLIENQKVAVGVIWICITTIVFSFYKFEKSKTTNSTLTFNIDETSFKKALNASLKNNGLLAANQPSSNFNLFVNLESFEQPLLGRDFKVTSKIKYKVVERKTDVTWYEELISASFTTTYGNNGLPVGGMRLANEGAVRENIREFIRSLLKKDSSNIIKIDEKKSEPSPLSAIQRLQNLQEKLDGGLIKEKEYILKRDQILDNL